MMPDRSGDNKARHTTRKALRGRLLKSRVAAARYSLGTMAGKSGRRDPAGISRETPTSAASRDQAVGGAPGVPGG